MTDQLAFRLVCNKCVCVYYIALLVVERCTLHNAGKPEPYLLLRYPLLSSQGSE